MHRVASVNLVPEAARRVASKTLRSARFDDDHEYDEEVVPPFDTCPAHSEPADDA